MSYLRLRLNTSFLLYFWLFYLKYSLLSALLNLLAAVTFFAKHLVRPLLALVLLSAHLRELRIRLLSLRSQVLIMRKRPIKSWQRKMERIIYILFRGSWLHLGLLLWCILDHELYCEPIWCHRWYFVFEIRSYLIFVFRDLRQHWSSLWRPFRPFGPYSYFWIYCRSLFEDFGCKLDLGTIHCVEW